MARGAGRLGRVVAVLLATALLASGCGDDDDGGDESATAPSGADGTEAASEGAPAEGEACGTAEEPFAARIGIDIPFHPLFDYIQANADELFDEAYDVSFQVLDATTQVPAFGAGDLDIMTTVPSFIPRVVDQYGDEVVYVYPLARWTPGPEILVPTDSDIEGIEDLEGASVAIPPLDSRFGAEEVAILAATDTNIREYFDLTETETAAQELQLGRVEAAFIEAPSTFELTETGDFKSIYTVQDAFEEAFDDPAVMNGGYIARTSFADSCPAFIDELVRVNQEVWDLYQSDPDEVNQVASEISGVPVEQLEVVGQVLNLADMPDEGKRVTERDVATWERCFPLLAESGFITEAPEDVASLFRIS